MTIHELIKIAKKKLKNSTSPELDGEVLLAFALKKTKEYLLANPFRKVDLKSEKLYLKLINKRLLGWPVAYLTKNKEFYSLNFYVDKNVLIPRPETEGLIDLILHYAKNKKNLKILDIGTGSGCIIISLAKKLGSKNKYFASDISVRAVSVAKKNAKAHKAKVTFGDGDLLKPWNKFKFDIIVANLPYLVRSTVSVKFEPTGALISAKKGLKHYIDLFRQISSLTPRPNVPVRYGRALPSTLFLEIGRDQGHLIKKQVTKYLPAYQTKIVKDLSGRQRYAVINKI